MKQIITGLAIAIVAFLVIIAARNALMPGAVSNDYQQPQLNNLDVPLNTGATPNINSDGEQEVILKYENYLYQMYPSTLKKGVPVRLVVDLDSVVGCMTAVRILAFGVSKNVRPGDNVIKFTPDKAGEFQMACSMGMGRNTFRVVDDSGSTGAFVEQPQVVQGGGSCGGSGGCGCGGGA